VTPADATIFVPTCDRNQQRQEKVVCGFDPGQT